MANKDEGSFQKQFLRSVERHAEPVLNETESNQGYDMSEEDTATILDPSVDGDVKKQIYHRFLVTFFNDILREQGNSPNNSPNCLINFSWFDKENDIPLL
jgi:hypothetical protein